MTSAPLACRCDIMIHTANEFTQQHHRFLIAGSTVGLHPIHGGEAGGQDASAAADKGAKRSSASTSKASTAFAMPSQRCDPPVHPSRTSLTADPKCHSRLAPCNVQPSVVRSCSALRCFRAMLLCWLGLPPVRQLCRLRDQSQRLVWPSGRRPE